MIPLDEQEELEAQRMEVQKEVRRLQAERTARHLLESLADCKRSCNRALKEAADFDRVDDHIQSARLALKAASDAVQRLRLC